MKCPGFRPNSMGYSEEDSTAHLTLRLRPFTERGNSDPDTNGPEHYAIQHGRQDPGAGTSGYVLWNLDYCTAGSSLLLSTILHSDIILHANTLLDNIFQDERYHAHCASKPI